MESPTLKQLIEWFDAIVIAAKAFEEDKRQIDILVKENVDIKKENLRLTKKLKRFEEAHKYDGD